ncbi:hypothetical protein KBB45_02845 [Myxococcota bacterium]|jgi:hypothetical protein|nr:hypothetical protein [Myxococcota bacterium]MBP8971453.1 hypothetical protein [Myxococcota bacterium]OQC35530.1 MAG: hypothetical protein BWX66_01575 [Deltaproteobacteria bacterium ADurb.Bin058]HHW97856.1 hypothetical protein [Oligoflexales bacterium]HQL58119.1 hypothetical protein [Myxococcota bacterium]
MKYKFEHEFDCDRDTLMRIMYENGVLELLKPELTTIIEGESLEWQELDNGVKRRVRYLPVPKIKAVGPKKVDPKWMEWVEESEVDFSKFKGFYRNVPTTEGVAKLLKNRGEFEFVSLPGGRTKRITSGELRVEVFILGAIAERFIHDFAKEILDEESMTLNKLILRRNS